jgi:uncharacterized membrane protein YidH (DUF202 family)
MLRGRNMPEITEDQKCAKIHGRRVHMANERAFLAWIRTSIGIMAFGFVVEKFSLFINEVSYVLGKSDIDKIALPSQGYSSIFGTLLVGLGASNGVLAFI